MGKLGLQFVSLCAVSGQFRLRISFTRFIFSKSLLVIGKSLLILLFTVGELPLGIIEPLFRVGNLFVKFCAAVAILLPSVGKLPFGVQQLLLRVGKLRLAVGQLSFGLGQLLLRLGDNLVKAGGSAKLPDRLKPRRARLDAVNVPVGEGVDALHLGKSQINIRVNL